MIFDIDVALFGDGHTASCRIAGYHTHVVQLERDGRLLIDEPAQDCAETHATDRTLLNVADIVTFADEVDVDDVKDLLDRQISFNMAIAQAGMDQPYGARIGRILMDAYGDTVFNRAKAMAAAASDARMNGCSLPVAINSGVICDGAKSSCAAKIASAVEAGLLGMQMAQRDSEFYGGDGIVIKGVENTISNVSRLAREGMAETGKKIIDLMLGWT